MWSPYEIKVILHHYSSMAPFEYASAPLYEPTVDKLVEQGVLIEAEDAFGVTELGAALVKMWCETPIPVRVYLDPRKLEDAACPALSEQSALGGFFAPSTAASTGPTRN